MYYWLILTLFNPDGTSMTWPHPEPATPQFFATQAACDEAGVNITDGDGDNEQAKCVPVTKDELWCHAAIVTDYGQTPPKQIEAAPAGPCGPAPYSLGPTPG